jgi:hypothetical protein
MVNSLNEVSGVYGSGSSWYGSPRNEPLQASAKRRDKSTHGYLAISREHTPTMVMTIEVAG